MNDGDLAATLSSRICHDLVSPIGAVVNGVDLIREIGTGNSGAEIAMIGQSAERASALLQYYRLAFGIAEQAAADVGRKTLREHATQFLASPRIELDWPECEGPALTRRHARLLYQLLLCGRAILGMAGRLSVHLPPDATQPMSLDITAPSTVNGELVDLLMQPEGMGTLPPRLIEFRLARDSAAMLGLTLKVERSADRIRLWAEEA